METRELARGEELRVLQEEISKLEGLKRHLGWKYVITFCEDQIQSRLNTLVLNALTSMDQVLAQEYAKGEIHGLKLFLGMIDTILEENRATVQKLLEEMENADSRNDTQNT